MALRLIRPRVIWIFALIVTGAALAVAGCAGSPAAPQSQAPQESQETEDRQQAWNPVAVIDQEGRIFVTYYGGRGGANEYHLFFTRSLDGGKTWLPEPVQLDTPTFPAERIGFHQLETNGAAVVSVTWSIEVKEGQYWRQRQIRHRQSSDFGTSWTGEILRWVFDGKSNYPTPLTSREGELHLLWTESERGKLPVPRIIRTKEGGKAWAPPPVTLPGIDGAPAKQPGASSYREAAWPALTIDPQGALYALWQESSRQGRTDILFNRSRDGGHTWLDTSLRLNTPPPKGGYTSRNPVVAIDGNEGIYVVWEDSRHNTIDFYFNRSLDGGATWLDKDVWLTAVRPPQASASGPILSADESGRLYLLWTDIRELPQSLYFSRSLDKGATWLLQALRLDRHGPKEITYAPRLGNDGAGHVYAVWWQGEEPTKGTIRFNRSEDHGATWLEKEQILDSGLGTNGPRFPGLGIDGQGVVYIIWGSDRSGRYQLYLNRSTDHGKTWLPQDIRITGRPVKTQPVSSR